MNYVQEIDINGRLIGLMQPTYFIADIAANHDGDLSRAKDLIHSAREAGADAAKFQHFLADKIVSDRGFKTLGKQSGHQAGWKKSVYEIYKDYECNRNWTSELEKTAKEAGIDFFTTPYDFEAIEVLDSYVPAYKVGSGDITWLDFISKISQKNKPVILSTGASTQWEADRAIEAVLKHNSQIALLQCNTNYNGSPDNFKYVNLNVLNTWAAKYPFMVLGLSDHTPGHAAVLGAIAFGGRIIEKHFTDDNRRNGPDHKFSMTPKSWKEMVERSRELEYALGDGIKRVEPNEQETVVLQRRCLRLNRDIESGSLLQETDFHFLRPAPTESFQPCELSEAIGKTLKTSKKKGDAVLRYDV